MAMELKPVLAEIRLSVDPETDDDLDGALNQCRPTNTNTNQVIATNHCYCNECDYRYTL